MLFPPWSDCGDDDGQGQTPVLVLKASFAPPSPRSPFPLPVQRPDRLQPELEVEEVGEFYFEAVGTAAVVAKVDLAQGLGGDLAEPVFVDTGLLDLKERGGLVRPQRESQVAHAGLVGGAGAAV